MFPCDINIWQGIFSSIHIYMLIRCVDRSLYIEGIKDNGLVQESDSEVKDQARLCSKVDQA